MSKTFTTLTITFIAGENMEMVSNLFSGLDVNLKQIQNEILKKTGLKVEVTDVNAEYEDLSEVS